MFSDIPTGIHIRPVLPAFLHDNSLEIKEKRVLEEAFWSASGVGKEEWCEADDGLLRRT